MSEAEGLGEFSKCRAAILRTIVRDHHIRDTVSGKDAFECSDTCL